MKKPIFSVNARICMLVWLAATAAGCATKAPLLSDTQSEAFAELEIIDKGILDRHGSSDVLIDPKNCVENTDACRRGLLLHRTYRADQKGDVVTNHRLAVVPGVEWTFWGSTTAGSSRYCVHDFAFVPVPLRKYQVVLGRDWKGFLGSGTQCTTLVLDVTPGQVPAPVPLSKAGKKDSKLR